MDKQMPEVLKEEREPAPTPQAKKPFVEPKLERHEKLPEITGFYF